MKSKKLLSFVLALVLVLGVLSATACQMADDGKYTVGICQLVAHPALDAATQGFIDTLKTELGEENVEFLNENAFSQRTSSSCSSLQKPDPRPPNAYAARMITG